MRASCSVRRRFHRTGLTQAIRCYVTGPAAGSCAQSIVASPSGAVPAGAVAFLACGYTPSSSVGDGSAASVGTPCRPSPELSATFSGFVESEVTLDENNPACGGAVCLVNHFEGLTTCPYGQESDGGSPEGSDASACTVPGTSTPVRPNDAEKGQAVQAQCADRRPTRTVACSCRCANGVGNTNDEASYCTCPAGYSCTPLVAEIQPGDPSAGSYCIANGTAITPPGFCSTRCDPNLADCP